MGGEAPSDCHPFGNIHGQDTGDKNPFGGFLEFSSFLLFVLLPFSIKGNVGEAQLAWNQERIEVYLRNINVTLIDKAIHNVPNKLT